MKQSYKVTTGVIVFRLKGTAVADATAAPTFGVYSDTTVSEFAAKRGDVVELPDDNSTIKSLLKRGMIAVYIAPKSGKKEDGEGKSVPRIIEKSTNQTKER